MSEIKKELLKAAGAKEKKGEDFQDFAKRLIGVVQALPDDEWDQVSKAAQDWVNDGATAINAKKDIPGFPDEESGDAEKGGADSEEEDVAKSTSKNGKGKNAAAAKNKAGAKKDDAKKATAAPKGGAAKKKDADEAPPKKAATAKAADKKPAQRSSGRGGAQAEIKRAVIKDPTASTEDVVAVLKKKGLEATLAAVSTIRSGTLQTLRIVKELGMPKGDF